MLKRVDDKTQIKILENTEVTGLIKDFELREEEAKKAEEKKKQPASST